MARERRIPTAELQSQAWVAGQLYEQTSDPKHLATERALRNEITRRHEAEECDLCGYGPAECGCGDCAQGDNVVFVNEYADGARGAA